VGFKPTFSDGKWPQTYALDHVATGSGILTRMNDRARNMESKNRSGNENYVKSYNTLIEKCVNVI